MFSSLLVPLDGSSFSEDALPLARALASELGSPLHLVHVARPAPDTALRSPQDDMDWSARAREGAETYLEGLAAGIAEEGVDVRTAVLEGSVVEALDTYARGEGVTLVVMTTHGSGGLRRWWLGSVADGLIRSGSPNLLLVRPWDDTEERPRGEPRFRNVLVPLDGSEVAEAALPPALELSRAFGAALTLLRVVPSPVELTSIYGVPGVRMEGDAHRARHEAAEAYLAKAAAGAGADAGGSVAVRVVEDRGAAEGVIHGAKEAGADLIVLATRGHGGLARLALGSVADKVVRGTVLPALVVRAGAGE